MRAVRIALLVLGVFFVVFASGLALSPARQWPSQMIGQLAARAAETVSRSPSPPVTDLTDVRQLQMDFNASAGTPRLVMLLSPT